METATKTQADFKGMVKDIRIAMLCTHDSAGHIHSRPMGTTEVDDNGNIWFFSDQTSEKVKDIKRNPNACVCYSDPSANTYICVMGEASVVTDRQKIEELWTPALKVWFPEGKEDPNLTLLKIDAHEAEYWDSSSSKMVMLFNMAKSLVTGQEYDEGKYGKIKL